MGKQGPCFHCGIENSQLWRNGPADKPVLCNACGTRYRVRGSLTNYVPKHGLEFNKPSRSSHEATPTAEINNAEDGEHNITSTGFEDKSQPDQGNLGHFSSKSYGNLSVPTRKRSSVAFLTTVQKLHSELLEILHQHPAIASEYEEDELIYDEKNLSSNEIGLGVILLESSITSSMESISSNKDVEETHN